MIKNPEIMAQFEKAFLKENGRIPFAHAMKLFAAMWQEAITFGIFPSKEPMEGIDVDIKIAKVLNSCSKKSLPD